MYILEHDVEVDAFVIVWRIVASEEDWFWKEAVIGKVHANPITNNEPMTTQMNNMTSILNAKYHSFTLSMGFLKSIHVDCILEASIDITAMQNYCCLPHLTS